MLKTPTKKTVLILEETDKDTTTTTKKVNIFPYIIAIICAVSLYSFEFLPKTTKEYDAAKKVHTLAKAKRTKALNKVKQFTVGTEVYTNYFKEKTATDKAWAELKAVKKSNRIFGFTNWQQFLGEFGPMFCFFSYALYNLFLAFKDRKPIGVKILHTFIISGTMFYFFWIFQAFQDFSKITYYLMTLLSAYVICIAVYLITKYRKDVITKLTMQRNNIAAATMLHIKDHKKAEVQKKIVDNLK